MSSNPDQIAALSALYQAERSEGAALQGASISIVALAITYAGVTTVFLGSEDTRNAMNPWVLSLMPLPLWIIAVFLAIFSCVQGQRALSGMILEKKLTAIARLDSTEESAVGLHGSEQIYNHNRGGLLVKLSLGVTYLGAFLVTGLYTGLMLYQVSRVDPSLRYWLFPLILYLLLAIVIIVTVLTHDHERTRLAQAAGVQ